MYLNLDKVIFVRSTIGMPVSYTYKTTTYTYTDSNECEKESDYIVNITSFTSLES